MGSIPAWAGQPSANCYLMSLLKVYPRVGGATPSNSDVTQQKNGLSPRGRGNPGRAQARPCSSRSIPAWAGQP